MKALNLSIIALAAIVLGACATDGTGDEQTKATPSAAAPEPAATTAEVAPAPAPAESAKEVNSYGPHIDASAFVNALVESGCQIDKAEYKEVKRGGAIKIVCSKSVDPLNIELDDL